MFGLGLTEILLILAIALIIIGPKKLPEFGRTLGRALKEFKKGAQDFKRNLDIDTTLTDIKDIKDMAPTKNNLKKALKDAVLKEDEDADSAPQSGSSEVNDLAGKDNKPDKSDKEKFAETREQSASKQENNNPDKFESEITTETASKTETQTIKRREQ